ncbi:DUF86 domain-containing protein [Candidatus Pacearchaeota archaeon]|nr:DUF86 domain-containing protein [Candidatus Pacearchaeota archaeon]
MSKTEKSPLIFVIHILENIEDIELFIKNAKKEDFFADKQKQNAIIHSIEIIGEATRNLPIEFTSKYPYVEWSKIIGMRNKLSHGYFGVDLEIVWEVVKRNIPELKQEIIKIKKDLENEK